jgi:hypothetical protein
MVNAVKGFDNLRDSARAGPFGSNLKKQKTP